MNQYSLITMNSQLFSKTRFFTRTFHIGSTVNSSKPSPLVDSIIRVDHAGELGADRIYAGQMAVLGSSKVGPLIQHMWDQEKVHKETFEKLIVKHRVRPTALVPIWNVAGFLLGAGTALLGEKAAMACTVAVESVIVEHYNDQLRTLMAEPENNKELMDTIQKFRDDEQEHHDVGLDQGAEQAPFYKALSEVIKFGCKTAIAMSKGLLSHQNQVNLAFNRTYCTSVTKPKWDLYSAAVVERKPKVLKPYNEIEKKVAKMFLELEAEKSFKSDHEIKDEIDEDRAKKLKEGRLNTALDVILEKTAHEFEEESDKELSEFKLAPLQTLADEKNDIKSVKRKLHCNLILTVQGQQKEGLQWFFPFSMRKEPETMKQTAERALQETCGDKLKVIFLGNAPCGFLKMSYPKKIRTDSCGCKIFFFKALYLSGDVDIAKKSDIDYQWATRSELKVLLPLNYKKNILKFLMDDEEETLEKETNSVN